MKKIIFISAIFVTANAYAEPFNGAYIGAQGGYESTKANVTDTGKGGFAGVNFTDDISLTGANGGLFAGYGKRFNNTYAGVELEGNLSNADSKTSLTIPGTGTVNINLQHKYDYGASLRAGFFPVKDTLVYGKLGFVRGKFEDKSVNTTDTLTGARFGIGSETLIASNITVRADWSYTNYGTAKYSDVNQTGSAEPSSSIFRVGAAYSF